MWSLILAYLGTFFLLAYNGAALWSWITGRSMPVLTQMGFPGIVPVEPMDTFFVIYVQAPALVAFFLVSPLLFRSVWTKLEPHIPTAERKWAIAFVTCNSAVFMLAGLGAWAFLFPAYLLDRYRNLGCLL